jgi:hypothetical protein
MNFIKYIAFFSVVNFYITEKKNQQVVFLFKKA